MSRPATFALGLLLAMLPACGSAAAPGAQAAGLDPASIAHVLYSWQEVYQSTGLKLVEKNFLLLTDGTARRGVPTIAPEQFDLAADRAAHPADDVTPERIASLPASAESIFCMSWAASTAAATDASSRSTASYAGTSRVSTMASSRWR